MTGLATWAVGVVTSGISYVVGIFSVILERTGMTGLVFAVVVALLGVIRLLTPVIGPSGAGSDLYGGHAGRLSAPKKNSSGRKNK